MPHALSDILQHPAIWRVGQLPACLKPAITTGFAALDNALPAHGWEQGAMSELLSNEQGIGELSLLAPALHHATSQGRNVVLVAPPYLPFPQAWESAGISLDHLLLIKADGTDLLWSIEQASRSKSCSMVLAWTTSCPKALTYPALRRLHVAAESGGSTLILLRPQNVSEQASPAPTRIAVTSTNGELNLRIVKRRGALLAETIRLNVHPDHWKRRTVERAQNTFTERIRPPQGQRELVEILKHTPPRQASASR